MTVLLKIPGFHLLQDGSIHIYIYIHTYVCAHVSIYVGMVGEREGERDFLDFDVAEQSTVPCAAGRQVTVGPGLIAAISHLQNSHG